MKVDIDRQGRECEERCRELKEGVEQRGAAAALVATGESNEEGLEKKKMELSALEKKMGGLYAKLKGHVLFLEKKMGVDDAPAVEKRLEGVCAKLKEDVSSLESKVIGMEGRLGMLAAACTKLSEADVRCAGHLAELGAEMKGLAADRERAATDMRREASEAVSQRMGELEVMWKAVEARADKAMVELAQQTEDEQAVMRLTQSWGRQLIEANQNAQRESERREEAMAEMQAKLREEVRQHRDQPAAKLRQELQKELREEVRQLRGQAVAGMRQELQKELREEVRQLRDQAVAEMKREVQAELRGELEQQEMLVRELLQQVKDMAGKMDAGNHGAGVRGSADEVRGRVCGAGCDVLEFLTPFAFSMKSPTISRGRGPRSRSRGQARTPRHVSARTATAKAKTYRPHYVHKVSVVRVLVVETGNHEKMFWMRDGALALSPQLLSDTRTSMCFFLLKRLPRRR
jgi:hypothetical protein